MANFNFAVSGLDNSNLATSVSYGASSSALTSVLTSYMLPDWGISSVGLDVQLSGADTAYFSAVSANVALPTRVIDGQVINVATIFNNDWPHANQNTYEVRFVASAGAIPQLSAGANPLSSVQAVTLYADSFATLSATGDAGAPSGVTGFSAFAGALRVGLSWTNPTDTDLSAVRVQYATGTVAPSSQSEGTTVYEGTLESTSQTGLTAGQDYAFSIFSLDNVGNWSSFTTSTTATEAPRAQSSYGLSNIWPYATENEIRSKLGEEGII